MTLLEVIDAARNLLNEPLDATRTFPDNSSSFYRDAQLRDYHNLIQSEIQNEVIQANEDYFVTQSYLSITNGTAEYSLPTGFIKVKRVEDNRDAANPIVIYPVTINFRDTDYITNLRSQAIQGNGYYLRGSQIVLTDTPTFTNASAIRLHYVKGIPDVTAAGTSSELPLEHHRILVWGVVKMALFQSQGDTSVATAEYEKSLKKLRNYVETRQIQRSRSVRSSMTNWGG